jgi:hypothetical protein
MKRPGMQMKFSGFFPAILFAACLAFSLASHPAGAESIFTVSGVHVDASAASSHEAYTIALQQGRPKAWTVLYRRLTRQQDWNRQPALDVNALDHLSRGYTIANERRSTTRYVADVTYMFDPEAVERILRDANIAYIGSSAKRILLVPMAPGYDHGAWAAALASPRFRDSVVPFAVPAGSAADQAALGGLNFDTATWADVQPVAARIHAGEAALVQAVYSNGHVTVNVRRIGLGAPSAKSSIDVPLVQTMGSTYPAAADAAVHLIEDLWKTKSAVDFSKKGRLTADVRVSTLAQWGALQTALAGVGNVTGITVQDMDIGEARIAIAYQGSIDQLKDAMSAQGLSLVYRGSEWVLAAQGGP